MTPVHDDISIAMNGRQGVGGGKLRLDCRNFRGDRPCSVGVAGWCPGECALHSPMGTRILIIKLGALGDVLRTAALLPGIKRAWPVSQITWVTRPAGVRLLANHPLIDRLLAFDAESICHLGYEQFDVCLSLDKEPGPAALAMRTVASDKRGIGLSPLGTVFPLNAEGRHYFALGLDNELKYRQNEKSYQRLIYEALGLEYRGERYRIYPSDRQRAAAEEVWRRAGVRDQDVVIGLNTGAGRGFANKAWPAATFAALAKRVIQQHPWRVALLGGPDEQEQNRRIAAQVPGVIDTGGAHDELTFAALLSRANVIVAGDTLAMHIAIAQEVPTVALFGPTCAQEIDLFGRGEKLISDIACSPCYRRECDKSPTCMDQISVERALGAIQRWVVRGADRSDAQEDAASLRGAAAAAPGGHFIPLPVIEPREDALARH